MTSPEVQIRGISVPTKLNYILHIYLCYSLPYAFLLHSRLKNNSMSFCRNCSTFCHYWNLIRTCNKQFIILITQWKVWPDFFITSLLRNYFSLFPTTTVAHILCSPRKLDSVKISCWILDTFEWNKPRCTYVHFNNLFRTLKNL